MVFMVRLSKLSLTTLFNLEVPPEITFEIVVICYNGSLIIQNLFSLAIFFLLVFDISIVGTHEVTKAGVDLVILLPQFLRVTITGMCHHAWLFFHFCSLKKTNKQTSCFVPKAKVQQIKITTSGTESVAPCGSCFECRSHRI